MQLGVVPELFVSWIFKNLYENQIVTSSLLSAGEWLLLHISRPECYLLTLHHIVHHIIKPLSLMAWTLVFYLNPHPPPRTKLGWFYEWRYLSPSLWTTQAPSSWDIRPDPPPLWLYTTGSSCSLEWNQDNETKTKNKTEPNWSGKWTEETENTRTGGKN